MPDIDWEKLEKEVYDAIAKKDESLIDFNSKKIEECKYQQKVAEINFSIKVALFTIASFLISIGITYMTLFADKKMWLLVIEGIFLVIFGVVIIFISSRLAKSKYIFRAYRKIILNAEKRLLSEGRVEPKAEQVEEPTKP